MDLRTKSSLATIVSWGFPKSQHPPYSITGISLVVNVICQPYVNPRFITPVGYVGGMRVRFVIFGGSSWWNEIKNRSPFSWISLRWIFTDSTMGFITIFHHHLREYVWLIFFQASNWTCKSKFGEEIQGREVAGNVRKCFLPGSLMSPPKMMVAMGTPPEIQRTDTKNDGFFKCISGFKLGYFGYLCSISGGISLKLAFLLWK